MKRMYLRTAALLLSLCLLAACGAPASPVQEPQSAEAVPAEAAAPATQTPPAVTAPQTTQSAREQTGFSYEVRWEDQALEGAMPENLFFLGDRLMLEVSLETGGRDAWDLTAGTPECPDDLPGEVLTLASQDEILWCCTQTENGLTLCAIENGSLTSTVELEDSKGFYPYSMAVDGDGGFCLLGDGSLRVYTAAGKKRSDIPTGKEQGLSLTAASTGQVLMCTRNVNLGESGVKTVDSESIGANLTDAGISYQAYPGWEGAVLLSDGSALYALELTGDQPVMASILDWIDTDVDPEMLISAASRDRETIYILSGDESGLRLGTLQQTEAEPETRTVLNLGIHAPAELRRCVSALTVRYNESQNAVRVHVVNYNILYDRVIRQDAENLDLILTDGGLGEAKMTDLRTLYDGELGPDALMPCVSAAFDGLDELTAMPMYFCVDTLVGNRAYLGEAEGWTPAELLSAVRDHPDSALFRMANAYDTLQLLMEGEAWVRDYASLLEAAAAMPADETALTEQAGNQTMDLVENLKSGSVLFSASRLDSFSDLLAWNAALEGNAVFKGYPAESGNGSLILTGIGGSDLSIPEASAHRDEAWDFLKYILSDEEVVRYVGSLGFPILRSAFDTMEQEAMAGLTYTDGEGNQVTTGGQVVLQEAYVTVGGPYETAPLSQTQADSFRELLESSSGLFDTREWPRSNHESRVTQAKNALRDILENGADPAEAAKVLEEG